MPRKPFPPAAALWAEVQARRKVGGESVEWNLLLAARPGCGDAERASLMDVRDRWRAIEEAKADGRRGSK